MSPRNKVFEVTGDPGNPGSFTVRINTEALERATPDELRREAQQVLQQLQAALAGKDTSNDTSRRDTGEHVPVPA